MKQLLLFLFIAAASGGYAQVLPPPRPIIIEPLVVEVSVNKLTDLVFHHRIMSVEVGSQDINVTQVNDTALALQSSTRSFPETNLSVYAGDGRLYSFTLRYADSPDHTSLLVGWPGITDGGSEDKPLTEAAITQFSHDAISAPRFFSGHRNEDYGASVAVKSLYIRSGLFFFVLELANHSGVDYDISTWHFSIRDKKRGKRTAVQEIELQPVRFTGDAAHVPSNTKHLVVVAVPKFTIPRKKYCLISVVEKEGGRNLRLKLRNKSIVKARAI